VPTKLNVNPAGGGIGGVILERRGLLSPLSGMTARNASREVADLLLIALGHGHDAGTLSSWVLFVKASAEVVTP
jgi:hypothetical protein